VEQTGYHSFDNPLLFHWSINQGRFRTNELYSSQKFCQDSAHETCGGQKWTGAGFVRDFSFFLHFLITPLILAMTGATEQW